ncbi:MAG TPA: Lsr2 family protein [Pseudonocardiaceae bacterium]|nr:Lsr2 family protein [Pseudonocardiaceae bacterium]
MASKTVVELFDDLDGGRADETVRFELDGVEYEIDLSTANAAALRDTLAVYIGHAHRPARKGRRVAQESVASVVASTVSAPPPSTVGAGQRNGKDGRNGKVSDSASMTAEIRRLASESAQKVSEAARVAAATKADEETPTLAPATESVRPTSQATTVGPVPALVIPFMEAGL